MMDLVFATNALNNIEKQFCPQTINFALRMTESNAKLLLASLDKKKKKKKVGRKDILQFKQMKCRT